MTISEFMEDYPPGIRAAVRTLRSLVRRTVPEMEERVYTGWGLIGLRAGRGRSSRYFACIVPGEEQVKLGFEFGAMLRDPDAVLTGTGSRVRYARFRAKEEIDEGQLAPLILEAAMKALHPPTK